MKKVPFQVGARRYEQIYDDTWYIVPQGDKDACCDCGLVHRLWWKIVDGKLYMKCRRDKRCTAQLRRWAKRKRERT